MEDELEQLIDLVRQYEAVYNVNCKEYRHATSRNSAWEEIAELHGKSVEDCKENWNKLRNCFNNAMKRRRKRSAQGKEIPPWKYEDQMSFLKPYMDGRRVKEELSNTTREDNLLFYAASPESVPSRTESPDPIANTIKRKISSDDEYKNFDMAEMIETPRKIRNIREIDEVDLFFSSISKTVKKLPRLDQIRIKMELLKAVSESEIKMLELEQLKDEKEE